MDNSIYTVLAGNVGVFNNLTTIANNVANNNTYGYKADTSMFSQYITKDINDKNAMPNDFTTVSDFKEGALKVTNRPLDFAINGVGFFAVQTPLGVRYTRKGDFRLNNENILVTPEGYPVLSDGGDNIMFDINDREPLVSAEGIVYVYNGADRSNPEQRGTIGVFNFLNSKLLRKAGDNLFMSDIPGEIQENINYKIVQNAVEESNVNSIMEMNKLIQVQRQAEISTSLTDGIYSVYKNAYRVISKQTM